MTPDTTNSRTTQRRAALWLMILVLFVLVVSAWFGSMLTQVSWPKPSAMLAPADPTPPVSTSPFVTVAPNTVVKIIDGDTFRLASGETVRYIGINAPEIQHGQKPAECYGSESTKINTELILNRAVRLDRDKSDKDKFGRLLRYVWLEDQLINQVLIEKGAAVAKAYPPDIAYKLQLASASAKAKQLKVGLWSACPN